VSIGLRSEDDAGANGLSVEEHRARPAHPVLAAQMGSRQAGLTERVGKGPVWAGVECRVFPIEPAPHGYMLRRQFTRHAYLHRLNRLTRRATNGPGQKTYH
jgi:hypothetical protein